MWVYLMIYFANTCRDVNSININIYLVTSNFYFLRKNSVDTICVKNPRCVNVARKICDK